MQGSSAVTCSLLRLPREIRDLIWECLFISTTLTSGDRHVSRISTYRVKPNPNSLAILRTCQQIHRETKDLWLKLVLFDFTHIEFLLDKFSPLPLPVLSQIRRTRVSSRPLMLSPPDCDDDIYYRLDSAFALVPGLQLKTLEVDATVESDMVVYDTISRLVERGSGWRELQVFIPNSKVLAYKVDPDEFFGFPEYRRTPQPDGWTRALRRRDGQNSASEVKIYRTRQPNADPGAVYDPSMRETFTQKPQANSTFGLEEDAFLISEQELGNQMLVVVKRAPDAEIVEDIERQNAQEYDGEDIRQWAGNMTWDEIRKASMSLFDDDESFEEGDGSSEEGNSEHEPFAF
ncbi:hypothetical protein GP486_000746 [Trichoglossum hirsutum]|uniref:F-box domain-containing protein n=1 Tax=Trichoglossum hirsutum TaxID=265104 RepID=A0A9P8LIG0_9PEZI|nr:hypothetical protein GP486_000746 [Trichoglossum hirsutum]